MSNEQTKLENLVNPEVMADGISAKLPKKIRVMPFAKIDNTLVGVAGNTVTVPKFAYIGDAEDVAEGVECGTVKLTASTTQATVKKAMKGVEITDEAALSGYGNPVGEAENQLTLSIAAKVDNDCMDAISDLTAEGRVIHDASNETIAYSGVVKAIGKFQEEENTPKAMFVAPDQETELRLDPNFISADKYGLGTNVMLTGEIGRIANTAVVVSKKVKKTGGYYINPIIKLNGDEETEDDLPAITIYLKRNVNVETQRYSKKRTTEITVDEMYTAVVSNDAKLVIAKFKAATLSA